MKFFTFSASPSDRRLAILLRTCDFHSIPIEIIPCNHTKDKPECFLAYTKSLPSSEVACCLDGFDVLAVRKPNDKELFFLSKSHKILFGAERFCFHHFPEVRSFLEEANPSRRYRYLNGGLFAGRIELLRSMMEEILSWNSREFELTFTSKSQPGNNFNDQTLFGLYFLRNQDKIILDSDADSFWNLWGEYDDIPSSFTKVDSPYFNPNTHTTPLFLHASQLDKYYCVYVSLAANTCPSLENRDIDIGLFRDILRKINCNELPSNASPDEATLKRFTNSLQFRLLGLGETLSTTANFAKQKLALVKRSLLRSKQ
jgi:hypothetical protein